MEPATQALLAFLLLFVVRYLRTAVGIYANITYKPIKSSRHSTISPGDVAVIIPTTYKNPLELIKCIRRILDCSPRQVFVVTSHAKTASLQMKLDFLCLGQHVQVIGVDKLNKRHQILAALPQVKASITVLADDDVMWPDNYLEYLLAIFENPKVGAGGTRQRVRRELIPTAMNFLGIGYLERRVWNNITTNAIDGSISTLSGRTAAYRTEILASDEFRHYFTNDTWLGKPLNSDDDKCLTRYVYSHGWSIVIQSDPRSIIETTVELDFWGYLSQCMRWARAHWRGNFTVMTNERYWCSRTYPWGWFVIYVCQFMTPALIFDGLLFALYSNFLSEVDASSSAKILAYAGLAIWVVFTKILKLLPHLCRHPSDIKFVPVAVLFSYFHGIINIWALLTLNVTHWGSQKLEDLEKPSKDGARRAAEGSGELDSLLANPSDQIACEDGQQRDDPGTRSSLL